MLLHIHRPRLPAFVWRVLDAPEFKEENVKRDKGGKFSKQAGGGGGGEEKKAGAIPDPPQIKSQHATNIGKQKHLNQLHAHASAGEWGKVEAYPTPGSNTYAKMVQKYKADLLKLKPGGAAKPAEPLPAIGGFGPLPEPKPAATTPKPEVSAAFKNAVFGKGFHQVGKSFTGNELYKHPESGLSIAVQPPTTPGSPVTTTPWSVFNESGGMVGHGNGWGELSDTLAKQATAAPAKPTSPISEHYQNELSKIGYVPAGVSETGAVGYAANPKTGLKAAINENNEWAVLGPDDKEIATGKGLSGLGSALGEAEQNLGKPPSAGAGAAAGAAAIGAPLKMETLTKKGEKLGTTPGGTFEGPDGKKYYVKQTISTDHTKNEMLAAALFRAAGGNTFTYHEVDEPGSDKKSLASEWQTVEKDHVSDFTPAEKKAMQNDFALHAWLANWDVGGAGPENPGVNLGISGGKSIPLDLGGALLFRGMGKPKGLAFGNESTEWKLLRDPGKNPTAAKNFASMTKDQLLASAQRLAKVSDKDIQQLVEKFGPGTAAEKTALAQKLAARRNSVMAQAAAEAAQPAPAKPAAPAPPPPETAKPLSHAASSPPRPPAEIKQLLDGKQFGSAYHALESHAPKITSTQSDALSSYKGSGYQAMNDCMRAQDNCTDSRVKNVQAWLEQAKTPLPMTLWRRVKGGFADSLYSIGTVGMRFQERGFMSTSLDPGPMSSWGKLTMEIQVPEGSPGTTVNNSGESEVLFNRGQFLTIKSFDRKKKHMVCAMDSGTTSEKL